MARDSVSWPDLVKMLGKDGAKDLCNAHGGLPLYVPKRPNDGLLFTLGEVAAMELCKHYGGSEIIPVMGPSDVPTKKEMAIQLLSLGMSELEAAKEMRRQGMKCCIRTVQDAARAMRGGKLKARVSAKNIGVHRLPICLMEANGLEVGDGCAR